MEEVSQYSTVIIANGEPPAHPQALRCLDSAQHVVCCDGALSNLLALNIVPTVIVGDGDSLSDEEKSRYAHLLVPDKNQEYNDLTKAFNYCRAQGWKSVAVLGAFGLREDHALANISLIMRFMDDFEIVMISNYGRFTPIRQTTTFVSHCGQPVSIFSFTPETIITFEGLQYPVQNRQFTQLWEGSLNVALGQQFTIIFEKGKLLVYQAFKN